MKPVYLFFAVLALTLFAFAPATAFADERDDLEVTMEVLESPSDLDEALSEMDGPDDDAGRDEDWESVEHESSALESDDRESDVRDEEER